ncbi:uncharacterized protein LOC141911571 [Tubulanus polymorphus]|uniref:uncharacterized protein LOC141911571 n=1 Tax=Tubulanus polymorphus TaxID=672921 RepID=UPI003DA58665
MLTHHQDKVTYTFDENATELYRNMTSNFAQYMSEKYNTDSDSDAPEQTITQQLETPITITSTKDSQHVIKLATIIHIVDHYFLTTHNPPPTEITQRSFKAATRLLFTMNKQKALFMDSTL